MILAAASLLAFLSGLALMAGAVVARIQDDRYQPVRDRHHLGSLRAMPYDREREL